MSVRRRSTLRDRGWWGVSFSGRDARPAWDDGRLGGRRADPEAGTAGCVSVTEPGPCVVGRALDGAFGVAASADRQKRRRRLVRVRRGRGLRPRSGRGAGAEGGRVRLRRAARRHLSGSGRERARRRLRCGHERGRKERHVASTNSDAVAVFERDLVTGALAQKADPNGCDVQIGSPGIGCRSGAGLDAAAGVAASPDGMSVYVTGNLSDVVAIFNRNLATGALIQVPGEGGCVAHIGIVGPARTGRPSTARARSP